MSDLRRRILIVEDEETLRVTLTDRLRGEGYEVCAVADGEIALSLATLEPFDLVILDVALPGVNGFDVCSDLRRRDLQMPVLMLTARGHLIDRVLGLKIGADDYLTKPFDMLELLARIEVLFRRSRIVGNGVDSYVFGSVRVDFRRAEVYRDGERVEMSALELRMLRYLIEHRGKMLSRDELLDKVWGYRTMPVTRTVDVHIATLRQKLEVNAGAPKWIITVHGLGYKFLG